MNQFTLDLGDCSTGDEFTMAVGEQPQQRLENFGAKAVSDTELLAMIIQGGGTRTEQAVSMASRLIAEAGSIAGLISWDASDYRRIKGIGQIKGLQLATIAEIARRMMTTPRDAAPLLNRPELIAQYFRPICQGLAVYVELRIMWSARVVVAGCERESGHEDLGIISRWLEGLTDLPLIRR